MSSDILVIGGGAAGMMAALFAARGGAKVTLLEKNEKLGKHGSFLVHYSSHTAGFTDELDALPSSFAAHFRSLTF